LDPVKDQSYFLAFLTQAQLAIAAFPLGDMSKTQTRQMALQNNLRPIVKEESQDICFIKDQRYGLFLDEQRHLEPQPGPIVDTSGKQLGQHQGLHLFTIGQRRGINCPAAHPYYVVDMDMKTHTLIVGAQDALQTGEALVSDTNWLLELPQQAIEAQVQIRYRHRPVAAQIFPQNGHHARIRFTKPQRAITPGQGAVFYDGDRVLGGGWIIRP
jgi:tRNA-specific 2-thiouridylase